MTQGRGSAQGPKSPTIDSVNPQLVTVIIYLHSLSLANMQKKKAKEESQIKKKEGARGGVVQRRRRNRDISYFT